MDKEEKKDYKCNQTIPQAILALMKRKRKIKAKCMARVKKRQIASSGALPPEPNEHKLQTNCKLLS